MLDGKLIFSNQQSLGTGDLNDVVSTNVFDAGAAVKLFEGHSDKNKFVSEVTASGGTTPTNRARLVGADNDALTSNVITLADTGVSEALAAADIPYRKEIPVGGQTTAKRYYGVLHYQAGTTPTATVNAFVAQGGHSHYRK